MKIQRKLLTSEQKQAICNNNEACSRCPLFTRINDRGTCWEETAKMEREIKIFWDEEIEI